MTTTHSSIRPVRPSRPLFLALCASSLVAASLPACATTSSGTPAASPTATPAATPAQSDGSANTANPDAPTAQSARTPTVPPVEANAEPQAAPTPFVLAADDPFTPPHNAIPTAKTGDTTATDPLGDNYRKMVDAVHAANPTEAAPLAAEIADADATYFYAAYYVFGLYSSLYAQQSENRDQFWGQVAIADGFYHLFLLERLAFPTSTRYTIETRDALSRALEMGASDPKQDLSYLRAAMATMTLLAGDRDAADKLATQAAEDTRKAKLTNTALVDYYVFRADLPRARAEYTRQVTDNPRDVFNMSPIALASGIIGTRDPAPYKRYALMAGIEARLVFMDIGRRVRAQKESLDTYLREMAELRDKPEEMSAFLAVVRPEIKDFEELLRTVVKQMVRLKELHATFPSGDLPPAYAQFSRGADDFTRLYQQVLMFLKTFDAMEERLSRDKGQSL